MAVSLDVYTLKNLSAGIDHQFRDGWFIGVAKFYALLPAEAAAVIVAIASLGIATNTNGLIMVMAKVCFLLASCHGLIGWLGYLCHSGAVSNGPLGEFDCTEDEISTLPRAARRRYEKLKKKGGLQ